MAASTLEKNKVKKSQSSQADKNNPFIKYECQKSFKHDIHSLSHHKSPQNQVVANCSNLSVNLSMFRSLGYSSYV